MTEKVNQWVDKLKNPALILALFGTFYWVSIRLDKVDVIEQRLEKKITIIVELEGRMTDMEIEYLEERKNLEIEVEKLKVEISHLKEEL